MSRIGRDIGEENRFCILIPERQLRLAGAFEIAEDLIMMLVGSAGLDQVTLPGNFGVEIRVRILPPPQFVPLPVIAEDDVEIAVAVYVINGAAGLERQELVLDHVPVPAFRSVAKPDERRRDDAKAHHEIGGRANRGQSGPTVTPVCCFEVPGTGRSPVELERCTHWMSARTGTSATALNATSAIIRVCRQAAFAQ